VERSDDDLLIATLASKHASHVGVDHGQRYAVREAGDRGGGVGADPWKGQQVGVLCRDLPAVPLHHGSGGFVQAQGAAGVAQPPPRPHGLT